MKKAILVLIVFHVTFFSVTAQIGRPDTVTAADIYGFLNATRNPFNTIRMGKLCNPDSVKISNLFSYPEYNSLREDTTEIFKDTALFSKADKAFIKRQMARNKHFVWKDGEIKGVHVINGSKVLYLFDSLTPKKAWNAYYSIYKVGYNKFSVPLFSLDKKRCIVYRSYSCSQVYSLGNTNVYEYTNNRWIIVKSCSPWIH